MPGESMAAGSAGSTVTESMETGSVDPRRGRPPPTRPRFIRNAWYPAAWSREIGRALTARRILDTPVVLYRCADGGVAALHDTCPHRLLPLSMGRLHGDRVECGYHGMTFDRGGGCVRIPGQDSIPDTARVRCYPIVERLGLVWIWMGAPAAADPATVFDLPAWHADGWSVGEGDALRIDCHYLLLCDNLCDPAHVSFVHKSTLGNAESEDVPVRTRAFDDRIEVSRWILAAPPIPVFANLGVFDGPVDRWHYYALHAPATAIIDFGTAAAGAIDPDHGDRSTGHRIYACHFMTPVDETTVIDHWLHVRNFAIDDTAVTDALSAQLRLAFDEDKAILQAIQQRMARQDGGRPVRLAIDAASQRFHRIIDRRIAAETAIAAE